MTVRGVPARAQSARGIWANSGQGVASTTRSDWPMQARAEDESETPGGRAAEGEAGKLTSREQEILRCMAQGLPTAKIAETLFISPVTVRNHIARVLAKLDVHTKLAAVAFAYRHGLVGPETTATPPAPDRDLERPPKKRPPPPRTGKASARSR